MTHRTRCLIEAFATAFFALSTLVFAVRGFAAGVGWPETRGAVPSQFSSVVKMANETIRLPRLLDIVSPPVDPIIGLLLLAVVAAGLFRAFSLVRHQNGACVPMALAASVGLVLAGIWPWLDGGLPALGPPVAILASAGTIWGVMLARFGTEWRTPFAAAFIAGWLLIVGALAAGSYLQPMLGTERAMLAALLATALIGTRVQLQIGGTIGFSLALVWAMIGISAATLGSSITIATACVLGISALAVALVRVTT